MASRRFDSYLSTWFTSVAATLWFESAASRRKHDLDSRSGARRALNANGTVALRDEIAHDRKTEASPRTLGLRREVGFEGTKSNVLGHPQTVVPHSQVEIVRLR